MCDVTDHRQMEAEGLLNALIYTGYSVIITLIFWLASGTVIEHAMHASDVSCSDDWVLGQLLLCPHHLLGGQGRLDSHHITTFLRSLHHSSSNTSHVSGVSFSLIRAGRAGSVK